METEKNELLYELEGWKKETIDSVERAYMQIKNMAEINEKLLKALRGFMIAYERRSNADKLGWNSAYSEAQAAIKKMK